MLCEEDFQINFATKNISSGQICDKKQIFKSALRQKADFQINSATKNIFFKIKFVTKNKFSNGISDKK